jgi:hypothetical protein
MIRMNPKFEIKVDPEIKSLVPPLKPEEQTKLLESIKMEGCRDPLVVWAEHNILLDGHNRFSICQELCIPFRVTMLSFPDKDHAMLWILRNQLGRRNLDPVQFKLLIGREYELTKQIHGGDRRSEGITESSGQSDHLKTEEVVAKEHDISPRTVRRSADLYKTVEAIREVAPEVAEKIESGEIKVSLKDIVAVGKALQQADPEKKEQIVSDLKMDFKKASEIAKEIVIPPEPVVDPVQAVAEWIEDMKTRSEIGAIPKVVADLLDLKGIKGTLEHLICPCCGTPAAGNLVWKCCGSTLDDAIARADIAVDKRFESLNPASRARQEMAAAEEVGR